MNPTVRRLLGYLGRRKGELLLAFLFLFLGTGANVAMPLLIRVFIDRHLTPGVFPPGPLLLLAGGYLLLLGVAAGASYLQLLRFQKIALDIIREMRVEVFNHLQRLRLSYFDRHPQGALLSRVTNDTEAVKELYLNVLSAYVQHTVTLLGIFIALFFVNVRLAFIYLVLLPIFVLIILVYRHLSGPIFLRTRQLLGSLNAALNEGIQGAGVIQAFAQEKRMAQRFAELNRQHYRARMGTVRLNGLLLRPLTDFIYTLSLAGVLAYFGGRALLGAVDVGALFVFLSYLERMFEPVNDMMQRMQMFQQSYVSAQRVFELMDEGEVDPFLTGEKGRGRGKAMAPSGGVAVEFRRVSFSYDGRRDVLKDISFRVEPGQTVAIVGPTGSGKTTLIHLLLRLYPLERGEILLGGRRLEEIPEEELRKEVGLVLQEPFLIEGTILENVIMDRPWVTEHDALEALQAVGASSFVERLPGGYRHRVGERGATFSQGERQLLALARVLAGNPSLLILDEATAHVDSETEARIQEALETIQRGRTTLVVAHRLSTIQHAHRILVLQEGRLVEEGTHGDLLARGGLYAAMYRLQQLGALDEETA
ncbi:MAG: ABC transporter ATP-binding protein/permease [Clostridiales bacterium]|nr:ABC transporter ATP-binding protein/permease [Clostridiales bacterium]